MKIDEKKQPILTISLLASNRPDTIRRCLDSVRELLAQIPGELILVDTSGSEEIHRILLEYTDQVVEFAWCDDFSRARNAGLELAHGEWFMFLDDDEWFVETKPLVDFFCTGEYRKYGCANYIVRNFYDKNYTSYSDSWVSRMTRRTPETRFKGRIHEYLEPVDGKATIIPAIAYHSGYIYANEEARREHFERNAALLLEMIREEPEVIRWKVQLAQEYRSIKDWKKLAEYCGECLAQCAAVNSRYDNYDIGTFYAGEILGYLYSNQLERGIRACEETLSDKRNSDLCRAFTYHYLGMFAFYRKDWKQAEEYMHMFLKMEREMKREPEKLDEQRWALLVAEAFDVVPMKRTYSVLIVCGWKQNHKEALHKYFKRLEWDKATIYELDGMPEYLIEAVAKLPQDEVLDEMLCLGWKNPRMKLKLFACAEGWKSRDTEAYFRILRAMSKIEDEHWYPSYAAVLYADHAGKTHALAELVAEFGRHLENIFLFPQEIREIAIRNQVDLEPVYLAVPLEQWCDNLHIYQMKAKRNDFFLTEQELAGMQKTQDIRYDYAYARLAEMEAVTSVYNHDFQGKRREMQHYADKMLYFYRTYYPQYGMKEYLTVLPDYGKAGVLIGLALDEEETNLTKAMELYNRAAREYSLLQPAMRDYMICLQLYSEKEAMNREEEFQTLLKKTKQQARELVEQKDTAAAGQILQQLKQLAPEDLEVTEMTLRTRLAELGVEETSYVEEEAFCAGEPEIPETESKAEPACAGEAGHKGNPQKFRGEKPVLSIALLVSNRRDTVLKCLDSLTPIREAFPCELIVLDTGCEEDLHAMIAEYADKIDRFTWCNDFSAARNRTVEMAEGEWYMYLDDDEWFVEVQELLDFFLSGEYREYEFASYIQRNFLDYNGAQITDDWVSRMVKLFPETHFESKIHEYCVSKGNRCKGLHAIVHHYGYIFTTEEALRKHYERNRTLLLEMIKEEPDNIRWWVHLLQEYRAVQENQLLYDFAEECLQKLKYHNDPMENINLGSFYAAKITAMREQGRWEDGIEECRKALKDKRNTELMKAFAYQKMTGFCYWLEDYDGVETYAKKYFKIYDSYQENEAKLYVHKSALIAGECFDDVMRMEVYSELICSGIKRGSTENLRKYVENLGWDRPHIYIFEDMVPTILAHEEEMAQDPGFERLYELISHNTAFSKYYLEQKEALQNRRMGEQIKEQLKLLLKNGLTEQARQVLPSIREMLPEDGELAEIEAQLAVPGATACADS
jgi:glycosyltransferase involved in cell wall biosynthesis